MKTVRICPECKSSEVKKIIYGLPAHDFDFDKYEVGGCCVTPNDPQYKCGRCEQSW
jgi:hypothetical protein